MYFWKTEKLAEEIKNKTLSDTSWLWYFIIWGALTSLVTYLPDSEDSKFPIIDMIEEGVSIIIAVVGTVITFKTNLKGGSAENYFSRVIALSFPISIKSTLAVLGFLIVVTIIFMLASGIANPLHNLYFYIFYLGVFGLLEVYIFWRTNVHLKYINS